MRISKKTVGLLSAGMSAILISSGALIGLSIMKTTDSSDEPKEEKPLNRGDNYEHYKISQYIQNNSSLSNLILTRIKDNKYKREIDSKNFESKISKMIKEILGNIPKFKSTIDKYKFDMSYRINQDKTKVLVDIVWYIPNNYQQYYYYDQFMMSMANI